MGAGVVESGFHQRLTLRFKVPPLPAAYPAGATLWLRFESVDTDRQLLFREDSVYVNVTAA